MIKCYFYLHRYATLIYPMLFDKMMNEYLYSLRNKKKKYNNQIPTDTFNNEDG